MRGLSFRPVTCGAVLIGALLAAGDAYTIPRYSARYEQECSLCHLNPAGGGERSAYATQYIVPREMAIVPLDEEALKGIDPQINDAVTIGTDLRTFFIRSQEKPGRPQDFFQMQGNLYLAFQLAPKLSAHLAYGINQEHEVYGLAYVLPLNGYVKLGRFTPDYGWKLADHTSFVRVGMGFIPPLHTDVGMEVGVSPKRASIVLGVSNGRPGNLYDSDNSLAVSGRAVVRGDLGGVGYCLGGSGWRNADDFDGTRTAFGPLYYLTWEGLTWIGEVDFARDEPPGEPGIDRLFASLEVAYPVHQGVDLKVTFDYLDPNRHRDSGTLSRYGLGVEVMPYPFITLEAGLNSYAGDMGRVGGNLEVTDFREDTEGRLQVHFFY